MEFWPRYRRTLELRQPPIQHIDLVATGVFTGILSGFSIVKLSPTQFIVSNPAYFSFLTSLSLFFLWLLGSWVRSYKSIPQNDSRPSPGRHNGDYSDDPITSDEDDILGRVPFVDRLLGQILKLPSPSSFVFGLYGSWGEGKTSVLTLLQLRLSKTPAVITVSFNPWYFADETALIQAFYYQIERELARLYILSGLHRTITRYKNLLTSALRFLGIQFPLKDDPERLRNELESWVQRIGCRIVIVIDDIDRLQSAEMLAVLKLARLSARLQHTVFLLSLDHLIVIETLKSGSGLESEFLGKIIQKPVPLPPAEQRDIDRFLFYSDPPGSEAHRSAIDRLLDELQIDPKRRKEFDDKFGYFYHTVARRLFITMRHAKRYMNTLRATLPSIINEVNLEDFFLLQLLQTFFPNIYKDIWSNPWYYLPAWSQEIFLVYPFGRVANHDERYRLIHEHVENLIRTDQKQEIAQEILQGLFFEVENAFKPHGRMQHDNTAETYLAEKRLTHPKCFPRYFLFRIPVGEFADEVVEKLIERWNSARDPVNVVQEDLHQHREVGQLASLFEKLRIFRQLISGERVASIARALCEIAPDLASADIGLGGSERYRAERFILSLINDRVDAELVERIIRDLVARSKSFPFLVEIVDECGNRGSGSYFRIYERVDIASLRKLASDRLSEQFIRGNRDIFTELSGFDLVLILHCWATNWRTDVQDSRVTVQNYVLELIDRKPEYLGTLLSVFTSRSISSSGTHVTFDYVGFTRAFEAKAIYERLERHGEAALTTPEAKEMAKLFREQFEAEKSA